MDNLLNDQGKGKDFTIRFRADDEELRIYREYIIQRIESIEDDLEDEDVEGHIWWHKFKEFIQTL